MAKNTSDRSARKRWGGGEKLDLGEKGQVDQGDVIASGGPGEGFVISPWALRRYLRVLRLDPTDHFMLTWLTDYVWEYGAEAFPSVKHLTREVPITEKTAWKHLNRLEDKGYIRCTAPGKGNDRRKRYDVSGFYTALAICILVDPNSKWAKQHAGPLSRDEARRILHTWPNTDPVQVCSFDLDFAALGHLNGEEEEVAIPAANWPTPAAVHAV